MATRKLAERLAAATLKPPAGSLLLVWGGTLFCAVACGNTPAPLDRPVAELPEYTREQAQRFDDALAPSIFDEHHPTDLRELRELADASDHVAPVRLSTVTRERAEGRTRYRLVLRPVGEPLVGPVLPDEVEVSVDDASPSLSLLRSMATEAVGAEFLIFLKRFRSNDESVWHFRGFPNTAAVRDACTRAAPDEG